MFSGGQPHTAMCVGDGINICAYELGPEGSYQWKMWGLAGLNFGWCDFDKACHCDVCVDLELICVDELMISNLKFVQLFYLRIQWWSPRSFYRWFSSSFWLSLPYPACLKRVSSSVSGEPWRAQLILIDPMMGAKRLHSDSLDFPSVSRIKSQKERTYTEWQNSTDHTINHLEDHFKSSQINVCNGLQWYIHVHTTTSFLQNGIGIGVYRSTSLTSDLHQIIHLIVPWVAPSFPCFWNSKPPCHVSNAWADAQVIMAGTDARLSGCLLWWTVATNRSWYTNRG